MLNWFRLLLLIVLLLGIVLIYGYQHLTLHSNEDSQQFEETKSVPLPSGVRKVPTFDNRTEEEAVNQNVAIFNLIPKSGSEMFKRFGMLLASLLGYHAYIDPQTRLPPNRKFASYFGKEVTEAGVYYRQMAFVNFSQFSTSRPIHLSVVRHPVERIASWFYYQRWPERPEDETPGEEVCAKSAKWRAFCDHEKTRKKLNQKKVETNHTLDECVQSQHSECNFSVKHRLPSQMMYFCGNSHECSISNSNTVLSKAKGNVDQIYSAVGILEDLEATWAAFESLVPKFFRGARELFKEQLNNATVTQANKNPHKELISAKTRALLEERLSLEIEFYEFCKQRLHSQVDSLPTPDFAAQIWPDQLTSNAIIQSDDYLLL